MDLMLRADTPTSTPSPNLDTFSLTVSDCILEGGFSGQSYGVIGPYGTGKTSAMRRIEFILSKYTKYPVTPIWFDAWRYEHQENVTSALAKVLLYHTQKDSGLGLIRKFIQSITVEFGGVSLEIGSPEEEAQTPSDLRFFEYKRKDLWTKKGNSNYAVFIDDLDRCSPEKAFRLLDHLKCLLEIPNFAYIIGLNPKMLSAANSQQYEKAAEYTVQEYLDKILQFSFRVPESDLKIQIDSLLEILPNERNGLLNKAIIALQGVLPANYRAVIKAGNCARLALKGAEAETRLCVFALCLMKNFFPQEFERLSRDPDAFFRNPHTPESWNATYSSSHSQKQSYRSHFNSVHFNEFVEQWLGPVYRSSRHLHFASSLARTANF